MDAAQSFFDLTSSRAASVRTPEVPDFNKYQLYGPYHYRLTIGARSWRQYDLRMAARYMTAVKLLEVQPGEQVLDAGSGEGVAALLCCRRGARAVAVELDAEAARLGEELARAEGFSQLVFRNDNLYALSLAPGSVDKAVSLEVIEHMADVPAYLSELHRVLKPGGRLVVSTPLRRADGRLQDRYHVEEFDHESLRVALGERFSEVKVYSCWPGELNRRYESNRPFKLAAKLRRALVRREAFRGRNPFVGPVAPDAGCALVLASAVKAPATVS